MTTPRSTPLGAGGEALARDEPRAVAASYDAASGRVIVELTNGCTFAFPARALQGLGDARDEDLAGVEVLGAGHGLHWEALDADFTVPGLLMGLFGTRTWMAQEQARRAGAATSVAKAAAARRERQKRVVGHAARPERGRGGSWGCEGVRPSDDLFGGWFLRQERKRAFHATRLDAARYVPYLFQR